MGSKIITSSDGNQDYTFGRAKIGAVTNDVAAFGHRDCFALSEAAFNQNAAGNTTVLSKLGQSCTIGAVGGANIIFAVAVTVTGDIITAGLVDGKDVSTLCTTAEAVQAVEDTGLIMNAIIKGVNNINFIIQLENSLTVDHTYHGITGSIATNGGSFGIPMYSDTTAYRVSVCVDTSINTMPCMGVWVATNKILTQGFIRDNTWNFTIGKPVYVNGSVFSTVIPPAVGDVVQVVGVSITADIMHFNPSYDWVVRK